MLPTRASLLFALALGLGGCATATTLAEAQSSQQAAYSGTRLDMAALRKDDVALTGYAARGISPPLYPVVDLPVSFVGDTAVFVAMLFAYQADYDLKSDPHPDQH